ncbi:uncharacterized protein LOC141902743 [Tubulanus polymorphus]|uniref:uncharacterized protein LOC141902743 n=1 Tax=Tubulanus polymorphus TaxID=672921 RepID=UPI003DA3D2E4
MVTKKVRFSGYSSSYGGPSGSRGQSILKNKSTTQTSNRTKSTSTDYSPISEPKMVDFYRTSTQYHRRPNVGYDDDLDDIDYTTHRKANRLVTSTLDDNDLRLRASRDADARLLSDITSKLNEWKMDSVKPDTDVSSAVYRRKVYSSTISPERPKITDEDRRRVRLRNPILLKYHHQNLRRKSQDDLDFKRNELDTYVTAATTLKPQMNFPPPKKVYSSRTAKYLAELEDSTNLHVSLGKGLVDRAESLAKDHAQERFEMEQTIDAICSKPIKSNPYIDEDELEDECFDDETTSNHRELTTDHSYYLDSDDEEATGDGEVCSQVKANVSKILHDLRSDDFVNSNLDNDIYKGYDKNVNHKEKIETRSSDVTGDLSLPVRLYADRAFGYNDMKRYTERKHLSTPAYTPYTSSYTPFRSRYRKAASLDEDVDDVVLSPKVMRKPRLPVNNDKHYEAEIDDLEDKHTDRKSSAYNTYGVLYRHKDYDADILKAREERRKRRRALSEGGEDQMYKYFDKYYKPSESYGRRSAIDYDLYFSDHIHPGEYSSVFDRIRVKAAMIEKTLPSQKEKRKIKVFTTGASSHAESPKKTYRKHYDEVAEDDEDHHERVRVQAKPLQSGDEPGPQSISMKDLESPPRSISLRNVEDEEDKTDEPSLQSTLPKDQGDAEDKLDEAPAVNETTADDTTQQEAPPAEQSAE